jgi:hypothetical protein
MKRRVFFIVLIFLTFGTGLFAFGRKQAEEEKAPLNPEWTLCITAFDTSGMSPSWQTAGDTVTRNFVSVMQNLSFRSRGDEESSYYSGYALARSVSQAADALARKRTERDLLIFRGDPSWKYQNDLKTVDAAILRLEEDLAKAEAAVPRVEGLPVFILSGKNREGTFPMPPEPGYENRFCTSERVDAFLTGRLSEYYGRIYLETKLYTRYTGSYSYEDRVLFSSEDFNQALVEISDRIAAKISEIVPSAILVRTVPSDAMILLDGTYLGQGEVEVRSHSPGLAELAVHATHYAPLAIPLELKPGEIAEVIIDLSPLGRSVFEVDTPGSPGSRVFLGSLYVGETPLTLELPRTRFSYVSVETPGGEIGTAIMRNNDMVRGSAQFVRNDDDWGRADILTSIPITKEEKRVENTRQNFYTSYGAFWFILPASLLTAGIAGTYIAANNYVTSNNLYVSDAARRERIANNAAFGAAATNVAYGVMVASLGVTFWQIFRYLTVSNGDSTPINRAGGAGAKDEE